jgi:S1-C subfamily serine protease
VALVALVAGGGGAVLGAQLNDDDGGASQPVTTRQPVQVGIDPGSLSAIELDVPKALGAVRPSIVAVSAEVEQGQAQGTAIGTAVVLTADGELLTNAHVVAGATSVHVRLDGEVEPREAEVLASDEAHDLALLKVDVTGLTPVVFADPDSVQVGDEVIAIGYALGLDGDPTVSKGIISAVDRTMITDNGALDGLLQTDAAISSGNSGGPLVNAVGEVVGINTAVYQSDATTAANNVGFAIGTSRVLPRIDDLRAQADGQTREEGYLGVELEPRTDGGQGAVITSVEDDSPAAAAGLEPGDVVQAVDGSPINGTAALIATIRSTLPGTDLKLTVTRDGDTVEVTATIAARQG